MLHSVCPRDNAVSWTLPSPGMDAPSLFDAAMHYPDAGLTVIPLNGKIAAIPWKPFQRRRPTEDDIKSWFLEARHNIGIVLKGLVVIDADSQEALTYIMEHCHESPAVTRTSRGYHVWYRKPHQRTPNRAGVVAGIQLDVKSSMRAYAVAPPSLHPDGETIYEGLRDWWSVDFDRLPYYRPSFLPVPDIRHAPVLRADPLPNDERLRRARAYISCIDSISGQGGERQLFRAACAVVRLGLYPGGPGLDLLREWNQIKAQPPWPDSKLIRSLENAVKYGGSSC